MKKITLLTIVLFLLFFTQVSDSAVIGDTCKSFGMIVRNSTGVPIRITGIRYYDYDVNRYRLYPILSKIVQSGGGNSMNWTLFLPHVGDDEIHIKLIFRYGKQNWRGKYKFLGKRYYVKTEKFKCRSNGWKNISVTKSNAKRLK